MFGDRWLAWKIHVSEDYPMHVFLSCGVGLLITKCHLLTYVQLDKSRCLRQDLFRCVRLDFPGVSFQVSGNGQLLFLLSHLVIWSPEYTGVKLIHHQLLSIAYSL
jgi:hypothetical protein